MDDHILDNDGYDIWGYSSDEEQDGEMIRIPYDKKITRVMVGKYAQFTAKFKGVYVSFSPKIILKTKNGQSIPSTNANFLNEKVVVKDGGIFYESGFVEGVEFFSKIFSFLNIM